MNNGNNGEGSISVVDPNTTSRNTLDETPDSVGSPLHQVPKKLDGITVEELGSDVTPLLLDDISSSNGRPTPYAPLIIPDAVRQRFNDPLGKQGIPRVMVGTSIEVHIHRVAHGAGKVVQAFTVFPRETLEVEVTSRVASEKTREATKTVLDSSEVTEEETFSNETSAESGRTDTNVTAWQNKYGGSIKTFSAGVTKSGSSTSQETQKNIDRVLQVQGRKASRARKIEVRTHNEEHIEEETIWRSKRSIFNPNYDRPIDIIVHESLGHFVYVIQVTDHVLIYQNADRTKEINVSRFTPNEFDEFASEVSSSDQHADALKLKLKDALSLYRWRERGAPTYYDPIFSKSRYLPMRKISYTSNILNKTFDLKVDGVVIGVNEVQLPSGDVIGRVRSGLGDARGDVARTVHSHSLDQLSQSVMLGKAKLNALNAIQEKLSQASNTEEALSWGKLLVDAMSQVEIGGAMEEIVK